MYLFMSHAVSTATSSIHTDPPSSEQPPHSGSRAGASMSCGDATCPRTIIAWNLWASQRQGGADLVQQQPCGLPAPPPPPPPNLEAHWHEYWHVSSNFQHSAPLSDVNCGHGGPRSPKLRRLPKRTKPASPSTGGNGVCSRRTRSSIRGVFPATPSSKNGSGFKREFVAMA